MNSSATGCSMALLSKVDLKMISVRLFGKIDWLIQEYFVSLCVMSDN